MSCRQIGKSLSDLPHAQHYDRYGGSQSETQ